MKTEKNISVDETKCTKCNKVKKQVAPYVIIGAAFFLLTMYGIYSLVKDLLGH